MLECVPGTRADPPGAGAGFASLLSLPGVSTSMPPAKGEELGA